MPIAEFYIDTIRRRDGLRDLGQDFLAENLDPAKSVASLLSNTHMEVGVALLTESTISGLGNVFTSEICFASRVNSKC